MFQPRKKATHSKLRERRRRAALRYAFIVTLLVIGVVAISSYVLGRDEITIRQVIVDGNEVVTDVAIQTLVQGELQGKFAYLFPKKSIFLYQRKKLEAKILDTFKRAQTASVSFVDFQSISVTIEERSPYALWCRVGIEETNKNDDCYFLDEKGFIYATAPHFSGNTFFRFYGSTEQPSPVGEHFLSRGTFREIVFFVNTLGTITPKPISLFITSKINMDVTLISGVRLLVRRDTSLTQTLENIQSFFESAEYQERGDKVLDYVDFRFGNKVYYTFK